MRVTGHLRVRLALGASSALLVTAGVAIGGCGEAGVGDPPAGAREPSAGLAGAGSAKATTRGGGARATGGAASARTGSTAATGTTGAGAGGQAGGGVAHEVADPEEARSFPVPASVHHRAASTPSVAGEAAVAAGAPSDAEVRRELGEEEQAKAQERAAQRKAFTPVAGGASVGGNGTIPIPTNVPEVVQRVIAGGNAITDFPYIWGGGHASFVANGYDCSGSVSYALAAGGLLAAPLVSGELASWGEPGPGRWITIYANPGHTFMNVDGVWFDTAGRSGPYASRWLVSTPPLAGYAVRHPPGL
jgi:cell wall-associated NlpC family hydrolase